MDEIVPFGGAIYLAALALLMFARGMDLLSTWLATPNLVLEGNPIAKWLGWRWGALVNGVLCVTFAFWPLPAIVISTASLLVAARNLQSAWLMRSMGEEAYRAWHVARLQETRPSLYLFGLFGQTGLTAVVGAGLIWLGWGNLGVIAIAIGILAYAGAVLLYTLLSIWRIRRSMG